MRTGKSLSLLSSLTISVRPFAITPRGVVAVPGKHLLRADDVLELRGERRTHVGIEDALQGACVP